MRALLGGTFLPVQRTCKKKAKFFLQVFRSWAKPVHLEHCPKVTVLRRNPTECYLTDNFTSNLCLILTLIKESVYISQQVEIWQLHYVPNHQYLQRKAETALVYIEAAPTYTVAFNTMPFITQNIPS